MSAKRIAVVGGSIAAVTAASALREEGYDGEVVLLSDESYSPYTRVPLSKGYLAGTETESTIALAALPDDVEVRLDTRAKRLDIAESVLYLQGGEALSFDGLLICTGARARRLAGPGQLGEHVVRTIDDVKAIKDRLPGVRSAIVLGAGFLGTETASTLSKLGVTVRVITLDAPLVPHIGPWMSDVLVRRAKQQSVEFEVARSTVELVGNPVSGVRVDGEYVREADIVISAVGDVPNVEWLADSALDAGRGVRIDAAGMVTPNIAAAGDVTVSDDGGVLRRSPNWTNAVVQARAVAHNVVTGELTPINPDPYHWTEQFGIDLKISGRMRCEGAPEVIDGDLEDATALLRWQHDDGTFTAASMNYRIPIIKLKRMGAQAPMPVR